MKHLNPTLKYWTALSLILLASIGITYLAKRWSQITAPRTTSEIYTRYTGREGLLVSFVKDYRVNDSTTVDVTVIQAVDTSLWGQLLSDFAYPVIADREFQRQLYSDTSSILLAVLSKTNPKSGIDPVLANNNVVTASYFKHTICAFEINDTLQIRRIIRNQLEKNI